jgi:cytochrome P450
VYFDFKEPRLQTDRFEYYRGFQEKDPVHWTPHGYWVLFRYDDVDALLRSPNSSANFPGNHDWARVRGGPNSPVVRFTSKMMLLSDGATHKRLRRVSGKVLSRRVVDQFRARVPEIVDELLTEAGLTEDGGELDVMSALALPLPVTVVCELIGIPRELRQLFRDWTIPISQVIDRSVSPQNLIQMNRLAPKFRAMVAELIENARRTELNDTLISVMVHNTDEHGEPFTEDDIVSTVGMLFIAGHETTINLIGNGLLALLRNPDSMTQLREDPSLMTGAIEELSRYEPSARFAARILTADTEIGGKVIPAGECVFVVFDAAGRDPERYPDPHRLDFTRSGVKSLAFSAGPHHCMGKTLATVEAGTVFGELLRRYPKIELATDEPRYVDHWHLRMLESLPIRLSA